MDSRLRLSFLFTPHTAAIGVDGGAELVCASQFADDFVHVASLGNGREVQHVRQVLAHSRQLEFATVGIPAVSAHGCFVLAL
jgi:hypothetical protein